MDLKKLHNRLYNKKNKLDKRKMSDDRFNPKESHSADNFIKSEGVDYEQESDLRHQAATKQTKIIGTILLSIVAFIILFVAVFYLVNYIKSAYLEEKVILEVQGSEYVNSGDIVEYKLILSNENRTELNNAVLNLNYSSELVPENFNEWEDNGINRKKIPIGTIDSNEVKEFVIPFSVFGAKDTRVYLDASLEYKPKVVNSYFRKNAQGSSLIKASLLQVEMFSTKEVASGEIVKVSFFIVNESEKTFNDIELKVNYPDQFSYKDSNIPPLDEERNSWLIKEIKPSERKEITVNGSLNGLINTSVSFSSVIGKYNYSENNFVKYSEAQDVSMIVSGRIEIIQTAVIGGDTLQQNSSVGSGNEVTFTINFKNTSKDLLRDLILREKISSRVIDEKTINVDGGYYDSEKQEIVWKASSLPILKTLEPNEEGVASFRLKLKDKFPVDSEEDKNFTIESQSSIESLDVNSPIFENKEVYSSKLTLKVDSRLIVDLTGSYNNPDLPNSGPLPLEANKETTLTPIISIQNTSNDLENVVFSASFPVGITWKEEFIPQDARIVFNERSNEFTWNIGHLKAGTGFNIPMKTLMFKLGIIPAESQLLNGGGGSIILMNNIKVKAKDSFTGKNIEKSIDDFKVYNINEKF